MKRMMLTCCLLFFLLGCAGHPVAINQQLPSVPESCAVLKEFRGEYSYGGLGLNSRSNNGELAVWVIYHSQNAAQQLEELFPQCQPSGKAYVLAALYHADRSAFQRLTNAFCNEAGDIISGSGCTQFDETRSELVAEMQRARSTMAFNPSRPPSRILPMRFVRENQDVYAEERAEDEARKAQAARGLAAFQNDSKLQGFTNLFRIEEPREYRGTYLGPFSGAMISAHLVPREALTFPAMVEVLFQITNNVVQAGIDPAEMIDELRDLTSMPLLKELNKQLVVTGVRVRAAGDRMCWNRQAVESLENVLQAKVPDTKWVQFIVDAHSKSSGVGKIYLSFFHASGTENYVVDGGLFEVSDWREQYARITGKEPKMIEPLSDGFWEAPDPHFTYIVDGNGKLSLVASPKPKL